MNKPIKLLFAGDVVMNHKPEFSLRLKDLFQTAAIKSCNFEAPIQGVGRAIAKTGPHVAQAADAPDWLYAAGFNLFTLANNHILDFGEVALRASIKKFQAADIIGVGDVQTAYQMQVKQVEDISFGFLAFGENGYGALNADRKFGHAWVNADGIDQYIRDCKQQVDVLIVQVHAGVELLDVPIPEWRDRYKAIIDAGADVLVAHHPHVVQGIEEYQGKLIAYSLGNFYFDYPSNHPQWNKGGLLELNFEGKKLLNHQMHVVQKSGQQLDLLISAEVEPWLASLQEKLQSERYEDYVDRFAVNDWEKHHKAYYAKPFNGLADYSLKGLLKHVKRLVFNRAVNYNMLWHNLFIESNKWLVERAIRYKMKGQKPD